MASIKISDLCPSEFYFPVEVESFLDELGESDLAAIKGGMDRNDLFFSIAVGFLPISLSVAATVGVLILISTPAY
jgi:hypothetical protein